MYHLAFDATPSWQCGKTEDTVESYKASVGGTSYASNSYGCKNAKLTAGANNGAGKVTISSQDTVILCQTVGDRG